MNYTTASKRFMALGQPVRLALLSVISECDGTQNVRALTDRLCLRIGRTVEQPTVSHHLACLLKVGLVERHADENEVFYQVRGAGLVLCRDDLTELARGKVEARP